MGLVLAAGFAAGIRAAAAKESTDPDILAVMAQVPNDQAPGACDVPKATSPAPASPTPASTAGASAGASAAASASAATKPSATPSATATAAAKPSTTATTTRPATPTTTHSATHSFPANCPHGDQGGPFASDFVTIADVAAKAREATPGRDASRGTFISMCGRNENNHRNPDNFIVAPGVSNGAHHVHDYVGNVSTDGFSTDQSLAAAGTTCKGNDRSAYFWPVLRTRGKTGPDAGDPGGGPDGNLGTILRPASVKLEFRGNAKSRVRAMPTFLRVITGDAKAGTNGPANARAAWTCAGFEDRTTVKYPICPQGSRVERILDFPSCWDGRNTDSPNHRSHIVFPKNDGSCWQHTVAVPQLRMVLAYDVPARSSISLDAFPEQKHNPLTDHADFANVMPDGLMRLAVDCINTGRDCDADGTLGARPGPGGQTQASPPGTQVAQQRPQVPPPLPPARPNPPTGTDGGQQAAAPAQPAGPASGGPQPTPTAPADNGQGTTPTGNGQGTAPAAAGQPDGGQQQLAEPPLPGLAGIGGPAEAQAGATASARAAGQPALVATGNRRTLLYVLNGVALTALAGWLVVMARRRRLR